MGCKQENYNQMQINSHQHFEKATRELQQMLAEQELRLQTCVTENQNISRRFASLIGGVSSEYISVESITLKKIAIANGRLMSPQQFRLLNENDYDVIMNCVDRKLLARKDPDRRTKLEKCDCNNIGRDRLKLLRCWLENPNLPLCKETIPRIFANVASMTPNALARAIGDLRQLLWDGPYIRTERVWGESVSHTGSVYLLNKKYKYLVIKYRI